MIMIGRTLHCHVWAPEEVRHASACHALQIAMAPRLALRPTWPWSHFPECENQRSPTKLFGEHFEAIQAIHVSVFHLGSTSSTSYWSSSSNKQVWIEGLILPLSITIKPAKLHNPAISCDPLSPWPQSRAVALRSSVRSFCALALQEGYCRILQI